MTQELDLTIARIKTHLNELNSENLKERLADDTASIAIYRNGLSSILTYIETNAEVFSPDDGVFPSRAQKEELWNTWQSYLDYHLALESIRQFYSDYSDLGKKALRRQAFRVLYAAFLAQYRFALELLEKTDRHHMADKILNDAVPEIGLPADTFAEFKFRYLNLLRAGEYAALRVLNKTMKGSPGELDAGIREDSSIIWNMGKGKGEMLTLKNAGQVIKNNAFKVWFPAIPEQGLHVG